MMLLFEEEKNEESEPKPELITVTAYLDHEHNRLLTALQEEGRLSKSEVVRQCIRLGYRTLMQRKAKGA